MSNFQLSTFNFQLIKVALVDDHQVVVEGFERLINESGVAGVIGKAYSLSGCLKLLAQSAIDILLLDVSLPDGNSIDLVPQIKTLHPELKIVLLSSHTELPVIKRALDAGVSGYIMKNVSSEVIIESIQTVASGKRFLCNETEKLLNHCDNTTVLLSRREQELTRLIIAGKSGTEIADSMHLSYETIKSYRKHLMFKLNVTTSAELVRVVLEQCLV
jgi:DNA-binding NarL/FixJ family response regulator